MNLLFATVGVDSFTVLTVMTTSHYYATTLVINSLPYCNLIFIHQQIYSP